ncbi:MAG TPA: GNAT family N-acetyltransferase [Thermomicrobiaceae bacterium]|nr:GNAT family N-acetyltransferase [Thermomicrobiaceae bacterium]
MTVTVRAATIEDAAAIHEINATPEVIFGTLQLPYQSPEIWRERLARTGPDGYHLVADVDERVVGSLGLHRERSPRRRHVASLGMSVHPAFHGRGIGGALLAAALDLADSWLNVHRVELQVYSDNAAAIHLYQKAGFAIEGTLRDYAFRQGRYVDAYCMARLR